VLKKTSIGNLHYGDFWRAGPLQNQAKRKLGEIWAKKRSKNEVHVDPQDYLKMIFDQ